MGAPFDSRDDRHAYVGYIFQNLNAFIMNLAPHAGIGDVAKRWPSDVGNELSACARQNYDLVGSILCNAVEGIDKSVWAGAVMMNGPPLVWNSAISTPLASRASFRLWYALK
jgi:hypothetical protein